MLNKIAAPFYTGNSEPVYPLGRYLPPYSPGVFTAWLEKNLPARGWLLDPFGSHPALPLEAAAAGYRVLTAVNNPILSLMLEVIASAPGVDQFQSVVAELAAARRAGERFENMIQSMYSTPCPACGQDIQPAAFLWRPEAEQPYGRVLHCPLCGTGGEFPLAPPDLDHLRLPGSAALSQARALERINIADDENRETLLKALEVYPTRALYALSTLINKAEGLALPPTRQRLLTALLISVCDECNTLWPWPGGRLRPRQLTVPPQYRENNPWLALENAVQLWGHLSSTTIPLTRWPELPPTSGGICLYPGRVRSLLPIQLSDPITGLITLLPRPNQAFWTLSAIWSGWLLGREAVLALKNALERRRYDWTWHLNALHHTFRALNQSLPGGLPTFAAIPEVNPGFISSALSAAQTAGLVLNGIALRRDQEEAQLTWLTGAAAPPPALKSPLSAARAGIQECLQERSEPAAYLPIYTAGWIGLTLGGHIPASVEQPPADLIMNHQAVIHAVLADKNFITRVDGGATGIESGWWGLIDPPNGVPLADQLETELVRILRRQPEISQSTLEDELCSRFTGLLTPPHDLLLICLQSYAQLKTGEPPRWVLQEQEAGTLRTRHVQSAHQYLLEMGKRFGYACAAPSDPQSEGRAPQQLIWYQDQQPVWYFAFMASSIISRCVYRPLPAANNVIVLPGGRANLLSFKIKRDPQLAEAARSWHFLKFRHLRQLYQQTSLTLTQFHALLDADPPRWEEASQMTFL